ncbi:MAG: FecR domain-containing protein [Candidatus Thiodiazotropha sp. (ex Myrtea sp. 'scaly one' KF741663)]|nr:FecR domain-containing protein [Candidatus Thiodiazotropha sp. (ex Myrtea sp. 'scaly one' KF741663)]
MFSRLPVYTKSYSLIALPLLFWGMIATAAECDVAQAVSVQGRVEVLPSNTKAWKSVHQGDHFCPGDRLRLGANSRAGLTLHNETLLRLDEHTSVTINAPAEDGASWLDLLKGAAHFISRVRQSFQVKTPYVNASIEGTEFTVETQQRSSTVSVIEGQVRAHNDLGEIILNDGQVAVSQRDQAPVIETNVKPQDAVQWALYYPPVIDFSGDNNQQDLNRSLDAYHQGDLAGAFAALPDEASVSQSPTLLIYRASLSLTVGQVESARNDLDAAIKRQSDNSDALALASIIETVQNNKQAAMELARQAVESNAQAASGHLALSYAHQANFQLEDALDAAKQAVTAETDNPLAWSRLAQIHLMFRQTSESSKAAQRAVSLAPDLSLTQSTFGFAKLLRLDLTAAHQAFEQAIRLDQAAPMPRLGLGLVMIRQGDLEQGRQQLETAASLDPGNALIRSYLGKAYFEEKRAEEASTQFQLAKQFDSRDPTAWFYDAILKQTENRPLESLEDLQTAIDLNDNRAVYRSRLLLDEDQAARNASLARIYDDVGFRRLALNESWNSLATDPANASAHRFLSDSYADEPRHEIARVSELLQAQLLQPKIVSPVSPSASETDLLAFQGSGPSIAGFNEYNPLFDRPRLAFLASGLIGSNNTRGSEVTAGAFANRGMLSAGYFTESSDGFRENNDSDQTIKNLFGQYQINDSLSIQGEIKRKEGEFGDLRLRFDPNLFSTLTRRDIESDSSRFGINYSPNLNNTYLLSIIQQDLTDKTSQGTTSLDLRTDEKQYEAQYIYRGESIDILTGLGKAKSKEMLTTKIIISSPFPGLPDIEQIIHTNDTINQKSAYAYANLPWSNGTAIVGLDYADLDDGASIDKQQLNPKLGLLWDISSTSRIRLAAFKTLRGVVVNSQTLYPTQVAGFNQLLDDILGTKAWRYGAAIDSQLSKKLYGGIELTGRTATDFVSSSSTPEEDHEELRHEAYLSWSFTNYFALTGRYIYEDFERDYTDGEVNFDRPAELNTQSFSLQVKYHYPAGIFGSFETTHVSQEISSVLPTTGIQTKDDSFLISNVSVGMRLPKRTGIIELKVHNLFDKDFNYQSIHPGTGTPQTSPYYPERSVFANLHLWF